MAIIRTVVVNAEGPQGAKGDQGPSGSQGPPGSVSSAFPFSGSAVITGSLLISGSNLTVLGSVTSTSFTGSLLGTASWAQNVFQAVTASYAQTSSNILGGKATHVPFFITDTRLATSSIYQSGSSTVIINLDNGSIICLATKSNIIQCNKW
jgi:hypothetical protein